MKFIISENRMKDALNQVLMMEGFDDLEYDWCNFNCGMGICCDPYCIIFGKSESSYDYYFKLVDSSNYDSLGDYPEELKGDLPEPCYDYPNIHDPLFDTIILSEEFSDKLISWVGPMSLWDNLFLDLLKVKFNINANNIYISDF